MEFSEIQSLIKLVAKSGVTEVDLETKDFKLSIKSNSTRKGDLSDEPTVIQTPVSVIPQAIAAQSAVSAPPPTVTQEKVETASENDNYETITSEMIGTFYRSPTPDKPPFINVGDTITKGDVICIIEAMKLFNEIEAEVSGKVVKVLVDDSTPVEYGQALFMVEPV